jgi:hypothetical protein
VIRVYETDFGPYLRVICDRCRRRINEGTKGVCTWEVEPDSEDTQSRVMPPTTGKIQHLCNNCTEAFFAEHGGPGRWRTPDIPLARLPALVERSLYRRQARIIYTEFPSCEREVVGLFEVFQSLLGWRIVHLQKNFPDAIIEDEDGNREVVEFEYAARNFKYHKHDPERCDRIICWYNNWPDAPLPVWALNNNKLLSKVSILVWKHTLTCQNRYYSARDKIGDLRRQLASLESGKAGDD